MARQADVSAVALAEAARQSQVALRKALTADVLRAWAVLDFARLKETWPAWVQVMTDTLVRYHAKSSDDAALFYRATRQLELGDPGTAKLADPPTEEWVSRALGYAAPGVYDKQVRTGVAPEQANRSALTQSLGTSSRIILDGSRTTIVESVKADRIAKGWYRLTDGDPCAFCALMASRGAIYKDEGTAGRNANDRFTGAGEFKWHNDCGCIVAPSFTNSHTLDPIAQKAADVYKNRGDGDALKAFRKAWANRAA